MRSTPLPMLRTSAIPEMLWMRRLMVQSASEPDFPGGKWPGSPSGMVQRTPTRRISPMRDATGVMEGLHAVGQLFPRGLEALLDQGARLVNVCIPTELRVDQGKRHVRVRTQPGQPGHSHEGTFDRLGDPDFHLFGRQAWAIP